jgi:hypothetical protein
VKRACAIMLRSCGNTGERRVIAEDSLDDRGALR